MGRQEQDMGLDRIFATIEVTDTCWNWLGEITSGYGRAFYNGKRIMAHRLFYELFNGEIPANLEIDHLCRNRFCVNPEHLEAVTRSENAKRAAPFITYTNSLKTHCPQGHEYTSNNTRKYGDQGRKCLECKRARDRNYVNKNKERLKTYKAAWYQRSKVK